MEATVGNFTLINELADFIRHKFSQTERQKLAKLIQKQGRLKGKSSQEFLMSFELETLLSAIRK